MKSKNNQHLKKTAQNLFVKFLFLCASTHTSFLLAEDQKKQDKSQTVPEDKPTEAVARLGKPTHSFHELVNLNAPKGGALRLATVGTFDGINNFAIKGVAVVYMGLCYETLMYRSPNEPFSIYPLLAKQIKIAPDKSSVTFYLNSKARFHDGSEIKAEDVRFTFDTLVNKGLPRYKNLEKRVEKVIVHDDYTIEFKLKPVDGTAENPVYDEELPMIFANIPVLSKVQLENIDFENSGLTPLLASGPYKVKEVDQGRRIVFERNPDYWGKDEPHAKGRFNFDTVSIEYFKNNQALFQAFLAKKFDMYFETNPIHWRTGYQKIKALKKGEMIKIEQEHARPVTVRFLSMNARKPVFQKLNFRRALVLAFDSSTVNKNLFAKEYKVPLSLFENTELAHKGVALDDELKRLNKYKAEIDPDFYAYMTEHPFSDLMAQSSKQHKENVKKALDLLQKDGYRLKKGVLKDPNQNPVVLNLMIRDEKLEKVASFLQKNLKAIGIDLKIQKYDANTYHNHILEADFDLIEHAWTNSLSPGVEQAYYFNQKMADIKGSSNYLGIKDKVAEELAKEISLAKTRHELVAAVRTLDRYVMHLCYQIPLSYDNKLRLAYWKDRVAFPALNANHDMDVMTRGWSLDREGKK